MTSQAAALVLFARAPELGRVKTRLAATLGAERALAIYRELAEGTMREALASGLSVTVSFTPAGALDAVRAFLPGAACYEPQCDGDLGARMRSAVQRRLAAGAPAVVVVGTDCPALSAALIHRATSALERADVVFGPAEDGGYYLMALRAVHEPLFGEVPWSASDTLGASLAHARALGLRVELLPALRDIDTEEDWVAYGGATPTTS